MTTNQSELGTEHPVLKIKGTTVTGLRKDAGDVSAIVVPEGVERIGYCAFLGCTGITSITIPHGETSVEGRAFKGCTGLRSITFPETLKRVENSAFYQCRGITSLTLPGSVTLVSARAFFGCSGITSLALPRTSVIFAHGAFSHCTALSSVVFGPRVPGITSAFIAWAVGNMRNRANWHLTSVKQCRNILRIVTGFLALERCDIATLDPDGQKNLFEWCSGLHKMRAASQTQSGTKTNHTINSSSRLPPPPPPPP